MINLLIGSFNEEGWLNTTYFFYLIIILSCFFISMFFYKHKIKLIEHQSQSYIAVWMPLLLLLLVKGFSICGTDVMSGYKINFFSATSWEHLYDWTLEPGYRILNVIIRNFTNNYSIFLFIIAILTIYPIYYVLKRNYSEIDIPIVILGYVAVFFFQALSLIRIYLAASICVFSFQYLVEQRYVKALICVCLACLFHTTSLIMFVPCIIYILRIDLKIIYVGMLALIVALFLGKDYLVVLFTGRYDVYSVAENIEIGLEVFCYYIPLIALFVLIKLLSKKIVISDRQSQLLNVGFLWVMIGMFIGILSYIVPIFGRMSIYMFPTMIFMGVCLNILRKESFKYYGIIKFFCIVYLLFRFQLYINGYYLSDGIMPYMNCFGLSF